MAPDAIKVIEETFEAIEADSVAMLVSDALADAWDGQRFDEERLRRSLDKLQREATAK